jgi:hypothetical protein
MPPTFVWEIGMDRLIMYLTNASIQEVLLFQMRPEKTSSLSWKTMKTNCFFIAANENQMNWPNKTEIEW